MINLIPITFEDGTTVYMEAAESAVGSGGIAIQEAGAADQAERALAAARGLSASIREFCAHTVQSLRELDEGVKPTKAQIEFGINVSLEGNVYLVKGTGEASIKITVEWHLTKGGGENEQL